MSDLNWLTWTSASGSLGFTLSLFSNSCLILMLNLRSSNRLGSYKHLLIVYGICTLFHASIIMLSRTMVHSYDDTLFVIHRKRFDFGKSMTRMISAVYCGCYALSFSLFAVQFIHRYISACKSDFLSWFDGWRFLLWLLTVISVVASWTSTTFFLFQQNDRTHQSFLYVIHTAYALDPDWTDYVPYKYFDYDEDGQKIADLKNMMGIFQHLVVIFISFSILFYCGIKTYLALLQLNNLSNKTRDLQFQIFRALVVQFIFPVVFVYFPTGFLLACPFFGISIGPVTNYHSILTQFYPGIDPLIFIFLFSEYRLELLRVLGLRQIPKPTVSVRWISTA